MTTQAQVFTYETAEGKLVLPLIQTKPGLVRAIMAMNASENSSPAFKSKMYYQLLDAVFMSIKNGAEGTRAFDSIEEAEFGTFLSLWSNVSQGKESPSGEASEKAETS